MVTGENEFTKLTKHNQERIYLRFIDLFQLLSSPAYSQSFQSQSETKLHESMNESNLCPWH